jgi:TRAP transporter TAXI family solute receptor
LLFLVLAFGAGAQTETRFFRIGAASTGGSFFEIGGVVAAAISSPVEGSACGPNGGCGVPGLVAVAQATQGSMENLRLINAKQLESGFTQASLASMAYSGRGAFADEGAMPRLRVIASLFPEVVHIVTRSESAIRSVEDLAGKRVSVGEPGSGTAINAKVLLSAAGFGDADVTRKNLRPAQAVEEMKAGNIDAIIVAGSYPVPAIQELAGVLPIRLVPITGTVADRLGDEFGSAYGQATIPAGSYRNVDTDTPTVGFHAQWIVNADAGADLIHDITRAVWSEGAAKLFAGINPIGRQIRLANALNGISVPLHPGAERFYRERGMVTDKLPKTEDRPGGIPK